MGYNILVANICDSLILGNSVTVARQTLTLFVGVRIPIPQPEEPTCFNKSVFQLNPPLRVGEILLCNVKFSLRSSEIAAAVGGFNFTFCISKIFHQRRELLISP